MLYFDNLLNPKWNLNIEMRWGFYKKNRSKLYNYRFLI